jgi:hypothetical protein
MSFPSTYFGHKREVTKAISVRDLAKSELRRKDHCCARYIAKIFCKHMRCSLAWLSEAFSLCLRKTKNSNGLTAAALLNGQFVDGII